MVWKIFATMKIICIKCCNTNFCTKFKFACGIIMRIYVALWISYLALVTKNLIFSWFKSIGKNISPFQLKEWVNSFFLRIIVLFYNIPTIIDSKTHSFQLKGTNFTQLLLLFISWNRGLMWPKFPSLWLAIQAQKTCLISNLFPELFSYHQFFPVPSFVLPSHI